MEGLVIDQSPTEYTLLLYVQHSSSNYYLLTDEFFSSLFSLLSSVFSLLFNRPNGRTLQVSYTYNIDELCKVQKGAVVTFSYVTFDSDGIPTFPKIHRVRHDVRWRDLVDDSTKLSLTGISHTSVYSSLPLALRLTFHVPSVSHPSTSYPASLPLSHGSQFSGQ